MKPRLCFKLLIISILLILSSCNFIAETKFKAGGTGELVRKFSFLQLGASTTVPGGDKTQHDQCLSVAVDSSSNVYCAGTTGGAIGEANAGLEDVFLMRIKSDGSISEY